MAILCPRNLNYSRVEKRKLPDNDNEDESQPKKRGRKPLSEEAKARRKAESDAEKARIRAEKETIKTAKKSQSSNPVGRPKKAGKALETD